MTDLARLVVALEAQTAKYQEGLDQANKKLARFQLDQNKILGQIDKRFKTFTSGIGGLLAGVGLAFSFKGVIDATIEAEHAMALLDNAVKATGGSAGFTTQQLADVAKELQKITSYDDEAIMGMEQLLLRFQSIKGDTFKRATVDALDLAAALGKDLPEAATLIGKALENPTKGVGMLAKAGVVLTKQQTDLVKALQAAGHQAAAQDIILTALEGKYRGAAEAVRNTLGGALAGLKNAFNDLLEAPGGMKDAAEGINALTDVLNSDEVRAGFATLVSGIAGVVEVSANGVASLAGLAKWVGETFAAFKDGVQDGDLVRVSDQMVELQKEIKRLQNLGSIGTFFEGGKEGAAATIAGYQKQLDALTAKYNKALDAAVALKRQQDGNALPTDFSKNPAQTPHTEEFTKLADKLKEQIALYHATGEAAKIAYMIQSGAFKEASDIEQQELLRIAKTFDNLGTSIGHVLTESERIGKIINDSAIELQQSVTETLKAVGGDYDELNDHLLDLFSHLPEDVGEELKRVNPYIEELNRNIQDILGQGLYDAMHGSFDDILGAFRDMIDKLVAQALAADIAKKLFGESGAGSGGGLIGKGIDFLGGLFGKGGTRDSGGRGMPGHAYAIGTGAQPEVYVPDTAGEFFPRGEGMGGGGVKINQNIYVQGLMDERTRRQTLLDTSRQTRNAMRLA
ncbi:MAG: phage tail length tape measure family protein [Gammaproteobacteria bacterium]